MLFPRILRRKRNIRRILAGSFLLIAFIEAGSHAYMDYHRAVDASNADGCRVTQYHLPTADCPDKRKQRSKERNMIDEMTIHAVILDRMSVPMTGRLYDSSISFELLVRPISGVQNSPFHPPKRA